MPIFGAKSRAKRGCASKLARGHRIGPFGSFEFAEVFIKNGAFRRAEQSPAPTKIVRILGCSETYYIRIPSGPSGQRPYPLWLSGSSAAVSGSCMSSKAFWASSKITCTSANASCSRDRPVDRSAASAAISSPESM